MSNNSLPQNNDSLDNTISYGDARSNGHDINVYYASKAYIEEVQSKPLSEIFSTIRTGQRILPQIEIIRAEQDPEKKKQLKTELPYFTMCQFKGNIRKNENFERTMHILLDCDHVGDVTDLKKQLQNDPHVFATFISPSKDGLKVIYKLESPVTIETEYRNIYRYHEDEFKKNYRHEPDHTEDPARECFLSYDPDLYVNKDAIPVAVNIPANGKAANNHIAVHPVDPLADLLATGYLSPKRTPAMESIIGHLRNKGIGRKSVSEILLMWNKKNMPPKPDDVIRETVTSMYDRYEHQTLRLPFQLVVKENCYYKRTEKKDGETDTMMTSFTMMPEELLTLEDGDCLRASIETNQGYTYSDIYLENSDWISRMRLLEAIGHQDCIFVGTDNDVQALCASVNAQVPIRKRGTRVIGLHDNSVWVIEGKNITASGVAADPIITPYQKGGDAFYHNIRYKDLTDIEFKDFIRDFYANILEINEHATIVPWLAWILTTPMKTNIMKLAEGYPVAFVHGTQGSGKTTTGKLFLRLHGYRKYEPNSCDTRKFPMLDLLCSTNGIPIVFDEFKLSDLKEEYADNLLRFMRKVYAGETEPKGQSDLTVENYRLTAPMCVMGEWSISIPAISERIIFVQFTDSVKKNKKMQAAFKALWHLPLEAFMPRYIQFVLQQDIATLYSQAKKTVEKHFKSINVAPRLINNFTVMVLGIELFKMFGMHCGVAVPAIDTEKLLNHELESITGGLTGSVRSAVDQLIEELSVMAQKGTVREGVDYYRTRVDLKSVGATDILAIRFNKVYPEFKEHARRTNFEGDQIDKKSYMDQFAQCGYIYDKSFVVKFADGVTHRCVVLSVDEARKAGIDLEGFGIA